MLHNPTFYNISTGDNYTAGASKTFTATLSSDKRMLTINFDDLSITQMGSLQLYSPWWFSSVYDTSYANQIAYMELSPFLTQAMFNYYGCPDAGIGRGTFLAYSSTGYKACWWTYTEDGVGSDVTLFKSRYDGASNTFTIAIQNATGYYSSLTGSDSYNLTVSSVNFGSGAASKVYGYIYT